MVFFELHKIMLNKATFVGFRRGNWGNGPPWIRPWLQLPTLSSLESDAPPGKTIATVKHFHNCIKGLSQFRTYCTNLRQYTNRPKRVMRMTMHRNHTHNFRFQLVRQKIVSNYNIATCCNSHVKENMLSSNCFNSIQVKTICWLAKFMVSLQNYMYHFDTQKRLKNTMVVTVVQSFRLG